MRLRCLALAASLMVLMPAMGQAQPIPSAVISDPVPDAKYPARMEVVHIPTGGVKINGIAYVAQGPGPHPVFVFFHGLPGNEKNLDLVQSVRRAGWTAVAVNYRGSWGSPGSYRFANNLEDGQAVLTYLRDLANAKTLGIDPAKMVIAGHSMGGWVVAHTAAKDHGLLGAVMISATDIGTFGTVMPRPALVQYMSERMESLADVTADSMANELNKNSANWTFAKAAQGLTHLPMLVLTSDDGRADQSGALAKTVQAAGGTRLTIDHVATDHSWSDHRIALQARVVTWLQGLVAKP
jgi:pimeloyl-ACP methyl ester carboxylesterase